MSRFSCWLLLAVLALGAVSHQANACPLCSDAIATGSGLDTQEDPVRLGRAYNQSIYLMVGMPYLLVGVVGFMIYRRLRLQPPYDQAITPPAQPLPPGDPILSPLPGNQACTTPSRADAS